MLFADGQSSRNRTQVLGKRRQAALIPPGAVRPLAREPGGHLVGDLDLVPDVRADPLVAGGRLGLSDLAAAIALSPSGLSKLLDRMDASGLIRREPDPDDQRAAFATITSQGRKLVRHARTGHHAPLRRTFAAALNERDLADVARIMRKLDPTTRGGGDLRQSASRSAVQLHP